MIHRQVTNTKITTGCCFTITQDSLFTLLVKALLHFQSRGALYHSSEGDSSRLSLMSLLMGSPVARTQGTLVTTERVCCCQACNGSLAASTHSDISPPFTAGLATNIYCSLWRQIVVVVGWAVSGLSAALFLMTLTPGSPGLAGPVCPSLGPALPAFLGLPPVSLLPALTRPPDPSSGRLIITIDRKLSVALHLR